MGCEIGQGYLLSSLGWYFDVRRKVAGERVGERDFAAAAHVGEQKSGEDAREAADFKGGIRAQRAGITLIERPLGHDPFAAVFDHTDDYAHALLLLINAIGEDLSDFGVGDDGLSRQLLALSATGNSVARAMPATVRCVRLKRLISPLSYPCSRPDREMEPGKIRSS